MGFELGTSRLIILVCSTELVRQVVFASHCMFYSCELKAYVGTESKLVIKMMIKMRET
jgi:hypothetical protein